MAWAILAVSAVAGIMGAAQNASAEERAQMLQQEGMQQWLNINIPSVDEQKLALKEFVSAGKLTPALQNAIKQDPSAFNNIVKDEGIRKSQVRALKSLEDLGIGKESFEDRAARESAMIDENSNARGHQKAIMSNLAQRGQLGGGMELLGRLDQNQADTDDAAKKALSLESDRRGNALKAIEAAGTLGGQIEDRDYRMASDKAHANDAISSFNTQNLRDVQAANVSATNRANEINLANDQALSDKNTALDNYQTQYNNELKQRNFEDKAKIAAGVTGQYGQAASQALDAGKNSANFWGSIAGNAPKVITSTSKYYDDQQKKQANSGINTDDIDEKDLNLGNYGSGY